MYLKDKLEDLYKAQW